MERTQHGNTVKRTGGIILPQRQRRILLEAVAHQKIGLFPARAEPCDEPPVPEQRVTGEFDAALDVIEQPVPLCAGIAQAIDGKFRRSTGCRRFKLCLLYTSGGRMRAKEDIHKDVLALIAKR